MGAIPIEEFWRAGDGDDYSAAFMRMQTAQPGSGVVIIDLGPRTYPMRHRLDVIRQLIIKGSHTSLVTAGGSTVVPQTTLNWSSATPSSDNVGIIVWGGSSYPGGIYGSVTVSAMAGSGFNSLVTFWMEHVQLLGPGQTGGSIAHGICSTESIQLRHCRIGGSGLGFNGDGIRFFGDHGTGSPYAESSVWGAGNDLPMPGYPPYVLSPGRTMTMASAGGGNWTLTDPSASFSSNLFGLQGMLITTSGFANSGNNGSFLLLGMTSNSVTFANASGAAETTSTGQYKINPGSNCNFWHVEDTTVYEVAGSGLYTHGGDSSGGVSILNHFVHCLHWGIEDTSFLGNTYIENEIVPTGAPSPGSLGAIRAVGGSNTSSFVNCYIEGSWLCNILAPSTVFGGQNIIHSPGDTGFYLLGNSQQSGGACYPNISGSAGDANLTAGMLGSPNPGEPTAITVMAPGSALGPNQFTRLMLGDFLANWWVWGLDPDGVFTMWATSHQLNVIEGRGHMLLPHNVWMGRNDPQASRGAAGGSDSVQFWAAWGNGSNNCVMHEYAVGPVGVSAGLPQSGTTTDTSLINITIANHGLATGHRVRTHNIVGGSLVLGYWLITKVDNNNFTLQGSTSTGGAWTPGTGRVTWARAESRGAAIPTDGTWALGDVYWNSVPAVGQPKGWFCTTSGSPGTFVFTSMGNL